jgi:hypothetical protein
LDKIIMGFAPETYKNDFELNNGDPTIDPSLAIERQLSIKQQKLKGTYKEETKEKDDQKFKLSLDGLYVEENKDDDDGGDSWRTDKDMEDEEKAAAKIMKEQLESEDYKKAQATWNGVTQKLSDSTASKDVDKPTLDKPSEGGKESDPEDQKKEGEAKDKEDQAAASPPETAPDS